MKFKKYKFIFLLVVLLMGLSITGWSVSANYDYRSINSELQAALTNDRQIDDTKLGEFSNNIPILFLISIGLIGLFGVRRQTKNSMKIHRPDEISKTAISLGRQKDVKR